jgi:signal transduction histidine kinase
MKRFFLYVYLYMLIMFLAVNFVVVPVFYRAVQDYFQQPVGLFWSNILSGYFQMIEDDLGRLPVDQWSRAVDDLQPHLAFPIGIVPMDAMKLSESETLALNGGEIVVQGADENFQHLIGQSGMVLRMGPMPQIESIPGFQSRQWIIQALLSLVVGVLFLVFALIWALPLAKNLKRISTAAAAFGQGALDVRAKVAKRSSLAPLAEAFNGMASRIQELITSHKELTHTVSHELRTPLARILFNMEMMGPAEKNSEREQHQEEIRRNVDELTMLVSELLTYARFDRENYNPRKEMLDLAPWLEELTARWNDEKESVRIDYRIVGSDDKVPIQANPRFLERAVCNLLQNAARHTRQRIDVTLETEGNNCTIHVDDDGPGVALADRQRIFEPFVRLVDSKESEAEGYGLGLAIVRRVAQWHGGRVTVENAPIGGARFTLRWPRLQQPPKLI